MDKNKVCIHFRNLDECLCNNDPDDPGECVYENGIEPPRPDPKCKWYETFISKPATTKLCKLTECGNWDEKDGCTIDSSKTGEDQFDCDDFVDRNEHTVFIEVSGGRVQRVFSTATDDYIRVEVLDTDDAQRESPETAAEETQRLALIAETYHNIYSI